ncbi:RIP homotypic interaction motif-containing protein [Paractinoplanes maris]|uniref:RIP homotypic interaction motif-containing protein n=1 Tax=Paractinoplanes maris TaxID=1734446 RepID=UPI00202146DB|nr:RIP homotypic interaction motif-containing protein [Actinoplanes maris]
MDLGELSTSVVPFVAAAASAYGGAVVQRATDTAVDSGADATVSWGRRLLGRLIASRRGDQVTSAVEDLAEDPADETSLTLVRAQVLKALTDDPALAAEIEAMLREAPTPGDRYTITVTNSHGFQIGSHNVQTNVSRPQH